MVHLSWIKEFRLFLFSCILMMTYDKSQKNSTKKNVVIQVKFFKLLSTKKALIRAAVFAVCLKNSFFSYCWLVG